MLENNDNVEYFRRKKISSDGYITEELWGKKYDNDGEVIKKECVMDSELLEHIDDMMRKREEPVKKIFDIFAKEEEKKREILRRFSEINERK